MSYEEGGERQWGCQLMQNLLATSKKVRLRQLRCFVAVARKKSFVLASEDLGLTQPAVSRSVRELEQVLGHDLFDRSTRGAELTPRGRTFLEATESGLLQIFQGVRSVTGEILSDEIVRIGALPNVCSQFLPAIVQTFKGEYPGVKVRVTPGTNADLLSSLRRGETDFVIGRLSSSEEMRGLVFRALFDEPLVFVVRAGHPLSEGRATLQEALTFPTLLPPDGTIIRQELSRFLSGQGVSELPDVVETTSSDFQRSYISRTDCVAVIPRGVVQAELESRAFVQLQIGTDAMRGPVGLTTNPDLRLGPEAQHLVQTILNTPLDTKSGILDRR
ncbi:LysR substrate-binding domain-containing protein [Antarctobacter jejuensis]|uniref:LysR substrate-binding domain-containing protein n=1 Tax=Antarctobacter jejuensis TaxID=1439938 RepID=UPI003FD474F6